MQCTFSQGGVSSTKLALSFSRLAFPDKALTWVELSLSLCSALPWIRSTLNQIPGFLNVKGYVDEGTVVGSSPDDYAWLLPVRQLFDNLHTAGFQTVEHSCWKAARQFPADIGYPSAGKDSYLPHAILAHLTAQPGQPTCLAALHSHVPSRGQEWPSVILCGYYYTLNPAQFRAIWEQGILWQGERTVFALAVTGCKCKAKTALVSTVTPTSPASFGSNLGWARSRHACR